MTAIHKSRAVGMSTNFAAPYGARHGRDPDRTRVVPQEPEFISTIKARSMLRAAASKRMQLGWTQTQLAMGPTPVILTYSGGQWRASTQWGALVESHFCYVECARRAKLKGFTPMSAA